MNRWFNDAGQLFDPSATGVTFTPINLPVCVTGERTMVNSDEHTSWEARNNGDYGRQPGEVWHEVMTRYMGNLDWGTHSLQAWEGGYWANNHFPYLHPWTITMNRDEITADWPADPAAEGCTLDYMHITYQGLSGQTFAFVFMKEWEGGKAHSW